MIRWLRVHTSTAGGLSLIPNQGTKIPRFAGEKKITLEAQGPLVGETSVSIHSEHSSVLPSSIC